MPTIKLIGGKVVMKDGKASCTCCEAAECCMYPVGTTATDLPDSVRLTYDYAVGLELTRDGGSFGPATAGGVSYEIAASGSVWGVFVDEVLDETADCLITGDGGFIDDGDTIEDLFSGTYALSAPSLQMFLVLGPSMDSLEVDVSALDGETLTRVSLCRWQTPVVSLPDFDYDFSPGVPRTCSSVTVQATLSYGLTGWGIGVRLAWVDDGSPFSRSGSALKAATQAAPDAATPTYTILSPLRGSNITIS